MAIGTFPGMLQEGTHASRPAATAVGSGALYACSDHSIIYQSDGSTWSSWWVGSAAGDILDLPTAEMDDTLVLAPDGAGGVEFRAEAGGGGGVSWTQIVNESGASFANFTQIDGTWAADAGGFIKQTEVSANSREARYNTIIPFGFGIIVEAEIRFPTAGQGAGANIQAKLVLGDTSAAGGQGLALVLDRGQNNVQLERFGNALLRTFTQAIALDTWYKARIVVLNRWASVYVDGTLLGSGEAATSQAVADYLLLTSYNALAHFRNVKAWTLTGGAPA